MNLTNAMLHDLERMVLIYAHIISCSVAIGFAFFADYRILRSRYTPRSRDVEVVEQVSRFVSVALVALWITGAGVILLDFGHVPSLVEIMAKPKLSTKMFVVSVLTLNGMALHAYALPRIGRMDQICALIGGISASSWLFAAFVGVAKPLGSLLSVEQFLQMYAIALLVGMIASTLVYRWFGQQNAIKLKVSKRASWPANERLTSVLR